MNECSRVIITSHEHHSLFLPYGMSAVNVEKAVKSYKTHNIPVVQANLQKSLRGTVPAGQLSVYGLKVHYQFTPTFRKSSGLLPRYTCLIVNVDAVISLTVSHRNLNFLKLKNNTTYRLVKNNYNELRELLYFESKMLAFIHAENISQWCRI